MHAMQRFLAVFHARNMEFFRDKAQVGGNLLFPILLLVGFSFIFSGDDKAVYKVGLLADTTVNAHIKTQQSAFEQTRFVEFVHYQQQASALRKLGQHDIDLVISYHEQTYWLNPQSPKSYLLEKIFLASHQGFTRIEVSQAGLRYLDWVLPGILGMNMMFSCLFGVGYVIVRYRKNAVLKRLKATPLSAFEFVTAQLFSRLAIVLLTTIIVYVGCHLMFDFVMLGSYWLLLLVTALGAMSLISLGLLVACRGKSEELTGGLLNIVSWPMMLLSGVWFSLEGASPWVTLLADFLPLTHLVTAARAIMLDGAGVAQVQHTLLALTLMTTVCLALSAWLFDWHTERS